MSAPSFSDFQRVLKILNAESPRGVILVAAAYIDELLGNILRVFLAESTNSADLLEPSYRPLGSLNARINVCYSLGLIGENEHEDLNTINSIRNDFAHSWEAGINNPEITLKINQLSKVVGVDEPIDSRTHFTLIATFLIVNLKWREKQVAVDKRQKKGVKKYPPLLDHLPD